MQIRVYLKGAALPGAEWSQTCAALCAPSSPCLPGGNPAQSRSSPCWSLGSPASRRASAGILVHPNCASLVGSAAPSEQAWDPWKLHYKPWIPGNYSGSLGFLLYTV
ncbi:hypothetical protein GDO78_015099 [Eleutherodactylus coqui]|uniref:Uncharacterized protein n=1 Tax=Eleutherodactylus coqui TaxID=57060 RepID=A0A8J6ELU1_ELECQ|nr:hypothetical protein GDO78_015099 [Eleutherodactylus coqui]